ncbi:MAG: hypothetical protein ABW195_14885 [Ilumatobacteraceae bacterium]
MPVSRPRRLGLVTGALVVTVGLISCGGSDDPVATDGPSPTTADSPAPSGAVTDRDDFVAAAAGEMSIDDGDVATCLSGAVVDAVGMEQIVAAGLTPREFARASSLEEMGVPTTLDDRDGLQAELAGCGDLVEVFATGSDDADEQACVEASLTDDLAAEMVVDDLTGAEPSAELAAARSDISACILDAVAATATT